jgi:hypothetical protein
MRDLGQPILAGAENTANKCNQPCYFPPGTQACCSKDGDGEFFDKEFYACAAPFSFLWIVEPSVVLLRESFYSLTTLFM